MKALKPYTAAGFILVIGGALFAGAAWLIVQSVPLAALGIAAIVVGVVALALSPTDRRASPEVSTAMLQVGLENLSALLEEMGLETRAVYLPSRLAGGRPLALVPLRANSDPPTVRHALPARLLVSYGPGDQEVGLLVRTLGTAVIPLLGAPPGGSPAELESALRTILVGRLDVASGVQVHRNVNRVEILVTSPRLAEPDLWISRSLGSALASIVATVVAEGLDQAVGITSENRDGRRAAIIVESFDDNG